MKDKPISMADVAQAAGVSKNTVSLALRHSAQIPAVTRRKVEAAAQRLGYRQNPVVGELMAHLRRSGHPGFQATLALVNANRDPGALTDHPTVPTYVEGCVRHARALGYRLDTFWMHDPAIDGRALVRTFTARGIRGAVLVGLMDENRLPERFLPVVQEFPCVVTGVRTHDPALSFACVDHHELALQAVAHARALGYRRPALVLDPVIDDLVEGRFTAGFLIGQRGLPKGQRIPPFYDLPAARADPRVFARWMDKTCPDVIFTLYNVVRHWLEQAGWKVPGRVGLIQLEWRAAHPEWAGLHQHNDIVGEAAIDMLIGMLHRGERGCPAFPRATLVGPTWVNGTTVRSGTRPACASTSTPSATR